MVYHVTCSKCKNKKTYKEKTLGECIEASKKDGWLYTENKPTCLNCKKGE